MIEEIFKIKFKGAAFFEETTMPFFENNNERISIIYGKNGSGKSTISKAVMKAAGANINEIISASFLSNNNSTINPSDIDEKCVYVFNEQYIVNNVRIKENGLDTIVMLGKQVGLDDLILNAESERERLESVQNTLNETYKQYTDSSLVTSPQYYINKMMSSLSGDDNWAGRKRKISDYRKNAAVSDDTYKSIVNEKSDEMLDALKQQYEKKLAQLEQAKTGDGKITIPVKVDNVKSIDENKIIALLSQNIEKPDLSEREEYLISLLASGERKKLDEMRTVFSDEETKRCPFCLQPISTEYKADFNQSISKVLSQIVEEHKIDLENVKICNISFDASPFKAVDNELSQKCIEQTELVNSKINETNSLIQRKIDNPYEIILLSRLDINADIKNLLTLTKELEEKRAIYNQPFENITILRKELLELNNKIAYYEIIELYNSYVVQEQKKDSEKQKIDDITNQLNNIKEQIRKLQEQKKSVDIALEIINSSLRYVFFSRDRLEIKTDEDCYKLMSNKKPVKPKDISLGERNILALCYFFTEILRKKEKNKAYSNELFIVIDDPVSSFDLENRVGIMSLLKEKMSSILCSNPNTKIIILSHDIQSVFDFEKMSSEIEKKASVKYGSKTCKYRILELNQKSLCDFRYKKRSEYTELIKEIYDFAANGTDKYELTIGNTMRRALESFSTFYFKMGIDEISYSSEVLEILNEECFKKYFENLMYRLVLNGESHMEERVRGISDMEFCQMYTKEEKKKTARDILVFLFLINPLHIKAHLNEISTAINNIEKWKNDIQSVAL